MAALAVASVLANPNVSSAIVGASRPEQLDDPVKAAEMVLDDEMLERIDDALGDIVERDPAKVGSFPRRVQARTPAALPGHPAGRDTGTTNACIR